MHDTDLDAARDQIAGRVDAPKFDELIARGARLRRLRVGVTAAAITVLAGGAAVGVGQPWAASDGAAPAKPGPAPEPRQTAEQIVDSPSSALTDFFMSDEGVSYSFWTEDCLEPPCAKALAVSRDGWRTRTTQLVPREADWYFNPTAIMIVPANSQPYLVDADGQRINVRPSREPLQTAENGVLLYDSASDSWSVIDPESGLSQRLPQPPGMAVREMHVSRNGDLTALGLSGDEMVLAQSTDSGASWSRSPVPPSNLGTSYLFRAGSHIAIYELVATGARLLTSSDSGTTWNASEHPPFKQAQCVLATDGPLLVLSLGTLWTSTDEAWLRYTRVPKAPVLECISSGGRTVSGVGPDSAAGYVSHDFGATWQEARAR